MIAHGHVNAPRDIIGNSLPEEKSLVNAKKGYESKICFSFYRHLRENDVIFPAT